MEELKEKAKLVRKLILTSTTAAGSGHPTSSLSATDLLTVLFDKYFKYDVKKPHNLLNDRLIFSKGHASPLFYTMWAVANGIPVEELQTLRKFGSRLEGHPTFEFPFTEVATGSLGQGLSVGAGIALAAKKDKRDIKSFVLMGDGELAEGQVWEAANFASYYKLNNLIAIADINRLGQSQETMFGHSVDEYITRFSAFNFEVLAIDGHNLKEVEKAFDFAVNNKTDRPFVIIAKTLKGKGISFLEDKDNWHGKSLKPDDLEKALKELGPVNEQLRFNLKARTAKNTNNKIKPAKTYSVTVPYKIGEQIATREVYGDVLAELGNQNPTIFSLDAETKNSTFAEKFKAVHPDRFIECFIAEQNMVGIAMGLSKQEKTPFASTFAAFFTRAFDQIRMSGLSKVNVKFVGSHAGVSIGEDGSSQMGLEDFAMFGTVVNSVVLHPSDAISTTKLLPQMVDHNGVSYLRTLRPKTSVLYTQKEEFKIGGSKILRSSQNDMLTIAACGITVHEALKAYEELKKAGILVRVVDCYSIKPVDQKTLLKCLKQTKQQVLITVEDHWEHGGLGDFVMSAVSEQGAQVHKMAVSKIPRSGVMDELLDYVGISAKHIVKKVKSLR